MKARCFRCQGTFDADHFGTQYCSLCGAEVYLPDPAAAPPPPAPAPPLSEAGSPQLPPATAEASPPQLPPPPADAPPPPPSPSGWAPPPPPSSPGWAPPPPPSSSGWAPLPPGLPPPIAEQSAPFAERARRGFLVSFWQTLRLVALEPARFFGQVKVSQTGAAVLFGTICLSIGNWGALLFGWASASTASRFVATWTRRMGDGRIDTGPLLQMVQGFTAGQLLAQAVATPLMAVAGIYLTAGVFHLLLLMVRGAPRGFEATLTVAAYASGILVLRALPLCGGLVAGVWFIVAAILGLAEAQRAGSGKAAFAVLGPILLACLCACVAGVVAGVAGVSGFNLPQATPPTGTGI